MAPKPANADRPVHSCNEALPSTTKPYKRSSGGNGAPSLDLCAPTRARTAAAPYVDRAQCRCTSRTKPHICCASLTGRLYVQGPSKIQPAASYLTQLKLQKDALPTLSFLHVKARLAKQERVGRHFTLPHLSPYSVDAYQLHTPSKPGMHAQLRCIGVQTHARFRCSAAFCQCSTITEEHR